MSTSNSFTNDPRTDAGVRDEYGRLLPKLGGTRVCSAKFLQSTIHLFNGTTQSCHHCPTHLVDTQAIKDNPGALHNTPTKVKERLAMRAGEEPLACNYCWHAESLGELSDRYTKTTNPEWSLPVIDRLTEIEPEPSYVELAFDNTCNFACMYCGPVNSSKWVEELERHGAYECSPGHDLEYYRKQDRLAIPQNQPNPYKDAFWNWWPMLYNSLHVLRLTGGEPLLSKGAWQVLDAIRDEPRKDLILGVNTNMGVPEKLIDSFIGFCQTTEQGLRKIQVYTSCEAAGVQAEYIRHGLDYTQFLTNCEKLLSQTTKTTLTFMMTLNALSIFSLDRFLEDVYDFAKRYPNRIALDFVYLRHPAFMDVRILEADLKRPYLNKAREVVERYGSAIHQTFFSRFYQHAMSTLPKADLERLQGDFDRFYAQYDARRGTNLYDVFPELL